MIRPIDPVKTINTLQQARNKLPTVEQIERIRPLYRPFAPKKVQTAQERENNLADYNDPLEINSLADAIANADAKVAKYGEWTKYLPLTSTIVAAGEHIWEHQIKPIFQGDFATAGLNILTDLSETADIFAQPFKALTVGGAEAYKQNLKHGGAAGTVGVLGAAAGAIIGSILPGLGTAIGAAVGTLAGTYVGSAFQGFFVDSENLVGRKNYDYDTGNLGSDIVLEIVSDPMSWVDIFTSAGELAAKTATKAIVKSTTKEAIKGVKKSAQFAFTSKVATKLLEGVDGKTTLDAIARTVRKAPFSEEALDALSKITIDQIGTAGQRRMLQMTHKVLETLDTAANGYKQQKLIYRPFKPRVPENFVGVRTVRVGGYDRLVSKLSLQGVLGTNPFGLATQVALNGIVQNAVQYSHFNKLLRTAINHPDWIDAKTGVLKPAYISDFYKEITRGKAEIITGGVSRDTFSTDLIRNTVNSAFEQWPRVLEDIKELARTNPAQYQSKMQEFLTTTLGISPDDVNMDSLYMHITQKLFPEQDEELCYALLSNVFNKTEEAIIDYQNIPLQSYTEITKELNEVDRILKNNGSILVTRKKIIQQYDDQISRLEKLISKLQENKKIIKDPEVLQKINQAEAHAKGRIALFNKGRQRIQDDLRMLEESVQTLIARKQKLNEQLALIQRESNIAENIAKRIKIIEETDDGIKEKSLSEFQFAVDKQESVFDISLETRLPDKEGTDLFSALTALRNKLENPDNLRDYLRELNKQTDKPAITRTFLQSTAQDIDNWLAGKPIKNADEFLKKLDRLGEDELYSVLSEHTIRLQRTNIDKLKDSTLISVVTDKSAMTLEYINTLMPFMNDALAADSMFAKILNALQNGNIVFKTKNASVQAQELARRLIAYAKSLRAINNFMNTLMSSMFKIDTSKYTGMLSSRDLNVCLWSEAQHLYKRRVEELMELASPAEFEKHTGFFHDTDVFLSSSVAQTRMTLEETAKALNIPVADGAFHTAKYDTDLTRQVLLKQAETNKELAETLKNNKVYVYDLETLSVNKTGKIREICILDLDGNEVMHKYVALTEDDRAQMTDDFIHDLLQEDPATFSVDAWNKKHNAVSLEELFTELYKVILPDGILTSTTKMPVFAGHNIKMFDNNVLLTNVSQMPETFALRKDLRVLLSGTSELSKNSLDTYLLEMARRNIYQLTELDKARIFKAVKQYAYELNHAGVGAPMTIHPDRIVADLEELKHTIRDLDYAHATFAEKIQDTLNEMYAIKDTKINNKKYRALYAIPKNYAYVTVNGRKFTNISAAVNVASTQNEIGFAIENIVTDRIYKFYDKDRLFDALKEGWSDTHLKQINRASVQIERRAAKYNNTWFLRLYRDKLEEAFDFLVKHKDTNRTWKTFMVPSKDDAELMAQIEVLYRSGVHQNPEVFKKACPEVASIINENKCYRYPHSEKTLYEAPFEDFIAEINNIAEEGLSAEQSLENWVKALEVYGVDRLDQQRYALRLARMRAYNRLVENFNDWAKKQSNETLFKLRATQDRLFDDAARAELKAFTELTDNELYAFYLRQNRLVIFSADDMSEEAYDAFLKRLEELGKFTIVEDPSKRVTYTVLNSDYIAHFDRKSGQYRNLSTPPTPKIDWAVTENEEFNSYIRSIMKESGVLTDLPDSNYLHKIKTQENFTALYNTLPEDVKKALPSLSDLLNSNLYDWDSISTLDNLLGTRRVYNNFYGEQVSVDFLKRFSEAVYDSIKRLKTYSEAKEVLTSPITGASWQKGVTNAAGIEFDLEGILTFLDNHNEYQVFAEIIDKAGNPKAIALPNNARVLKKYYDAGIALSIQTKHTGAVLMDLLNNTANNSFLKVCRILIKFFKAGVLAYPGVMGRNILDSYFKNVTQLGAGDTIVYTARAISIHNEWWKHYKNIMRTHTFVEYAGKEWFTEAARVYFDTTVKGNSSMTLDAFLDILEFFQNGPSSAILRDLDLQKRLGKTYSLVYDKDANQTIKSWYKIQKKQNPKDFIDGVEDIANKFLLVATTPTQYIERINRLAMFLSYSEKGYLTRNQIYNRISKTHFDFAYKSDTARKLELLIPFYSFTKDNMCFWIEQFNTKPEFFRKLIEGLIPVWNMDEYDNDELEANRSLQNQILTGQIVLNADANLTLKVNPSFLDVLNLFTNPVEAIEQRLISPLQTALGLREGFEKDYKDLFDMLPILGTAKIHAEMTKRNLERIQKNKKLTPIQKKAMQPFAAVSSLFGVTARYETYKYNTNAYYNNNSKEYYKNYTLRENKPQRTRKIYFPMDAPKFYSSPWYRYLYVKSLQRYYNR